MRKAESLHYINDLMSKSNDSNATWNIIKNYHYLEIYQIIILLMIILIILDRIYRI